MTGENHAQLIWVEKILKHMHGESSDVSVWLGKELNYWWLAWNRKREHGHRGWKIANHRGLPPVPCHAHLMVILFLHTVKALADSTKLAVTFLPSPSTSWSCCWVNFREDKCGLPPPLLPSVWGFLLLTESSESFPELAHRAANNGAAPSLLFPHNTLVMVSWQASLLYSCLSGSLFPPPAGMQSGSEEGVGSHPFDAPQVLQESWHLGSMQERALSPGQMWMPSLPLLPKSEAYFYMQKGLAKARELGKSEGHCQVIRINSQSCFASFRYGYYCYSK